MNTEDIYSGIWGEVIYGKGGEFDRIHIHDETGYYNPKLIIPNSLAAKKLISFLEKAINDDTTN